MREICPFSAASASICLSQTNGDKVISTITSKSTETREEEGPDDEVVLDAEPADIISEEIDNLFVRMVRGLH